VIRAHQRATQERIVEPPAKLKCHLTMVSMPGVDGRHDPRQRRKSSAARWNQNVMLLRHRRLQTAHPQVNADSNPAKA